MEEVGPVHQGLPSTIDPWPQGGDGVILLYLGVRLPSLGVLRQYTCLDACKSSKPEFAWTATPSTNRTSFPRLDIPPWLLGYHKRVIRHVVNVFNSIPSLLSVPSARFLGSAVLVTGGLGYVGSHVCLELLKRGYTVLAVDDLTNSFIDVVRSISLALEASGFEARLSRRIVHIPIDYGDAVSLNNALIFYYQYFDVTAAIHLAASKSVAESLKNPWKYYENNVFKMGKFLEVLGRNRIMNVVFSSSATVYGALPSDMAFTAVSEDMVPILGPGLSIERAVSMADGLTPYGVSKILGEAMIQKFVEEHPRRRAVVFRLFNPVGCDPSGFLKETPRDTTWCGGGVMQMVKKALVDDDVFEIYKGGGEGGDGSCIRDFVHVGDIARGIVMGFQNGYSPEGPGERCRVYNLASGEGVSIKQLVEALEKESGVVAKVEECGSREGDVAVSIGDGAKIRRELGWMPEMGVKEISRDFCKAYGIGWYSGETGV
ncbi:hypothetical protein TWF481_009874 [Arthrobotrys musiformis]|uniref:NAD-dependent epimerase/dehydratase domain-containing protein n=1 Tax=Arthrobotrys musiformis TaxID=47236 RepID=A0AAV9W579_9PEZI